MSPALPMSAAFANSCASSVDDSPRAAAKSFTPTTPEYEEFPTSFLKDAH
jgi:hypothetical protein